MTSPPSVTVRTSAPAKLILFGEHAVVYGKAAISTSLNLRTYATLKNKTPLFAFQGQETLVSVFDEMKRSFSQLLEAKDMNSVLTHHCISITVLGDTFHFLSSYVIEHFLGMWQHFSTYFRKKDSIAIEQEPGKPRVRTVDDDLVRKIDEMLENAKLFDPSNAALSLLRGGSDKGTSDTPSSESEEKGGKRWNHHQKSSLICIFYCFYVGLFHRIRQESAEENFEADWIQHEEKSKKISMEISKIMFDLELDTELPVGAGLGSSASFSVAVVSAFMTLFKEVLQLKSPQYDSSKLDSINELAYELECIIHGTPSGIDNTVSTYGRMIIMEGRTKVIPMNWDYEPLRVIIVNTKVPRNTSDLVAGVRERYNNPETHELYEEILDSIGDISNSFIKMIKNGFSREKFEKLIDKNQKYLNKLGVGHSQLSKVILEGKKYNLHGKLTGAGGGGCAFTYIPPNVSEEEVKQFLYDLELSGFWCKEVEISTPGVNIEVTQAKSTPKPEVLKTPKNEPYVAPGSTTTNTQSRVEERNSASPKKGWTPFLVWGSVASVCLAAGGFIIRQKLRK